MSAGRPVRVVVFGAGAVGSRFAAALARAGHEVSLVGRGSQLRALRDTGLRVDGDPAPALRLPASEEIPDRPTADVVLLTVKSYDVAAAGAEIARRLSPPVPVVVLSNGLGIGKTLTDALRGGGWPAPERWVVRGVHTVPARLVEPGRVRPTGTGEILLGRTLAAGPIVDALAAAFTAAGLPARATDDIGREEWRKALVNAAINPVTADHGIPNGRLVEEPWRGQAKALLAEALAVAAAEGFGFDPQEAERTVFGVVRATAENRSSMLEDVARGRRTEVDAISGAVAAAGRRHRIPTPSTDRAIERVHRREAEGASRAA